MMDFKKIILIITLICIILSVIYIYEEYNKNTESFDDMGVSYNKSTDWICNNISLVQITPDGTLINNTSPEIIAYVAHSTEYWAKNPLCVEFNVVNLTGEPAIHIFDGNDSFYRYLDSANGSHVKIKVNESIRWWIGNTEQKQFNSYMDDCYIRFVVPQNSSITYNDFKIYSI